LFEDLHWLDAGSMAFLRAIAAAVAGTKAMLVVNFRQSFSADWMDLSHYRQIALGELDAARTAALVARLIGDAEELRPVAGQIAARCGGNPFFAEELVRSLVDRGAIHGEMGNYRLGPKSDEDRLPASVQAIIGARIDALTPQEKNVVHIAAVVGKEFPLSVVQAVAKAPRQRIESILDRLHEAQIIEPKFGAEDEYFFRHPLIQEVAYNGQLRSRRGELHAAVAIALESHYSTNIDEFAALIAHHHESAGSNGQAALYAARAAIWIGSAISSQALDHWHQVRRLLDEEPASIVNDTLRMRASGQIASFGWREGMTADQVKPFLEEALELAREKDHSMLSILLAADGRMAVASGEPMDAYVTRVKEALAIADIANDEGRVATLNALLCHANALAGYLDDALEANGRALAGVDAIGTFDEQFCGLDIEQWMQTQRARILIRLGRDDEAEACIAGLLSGEDGLLDPAVRFIPHLVRVERAFFRADPTSARQSAARIGEIAAQGRNPYLDVYTAGSMGLALGAEGDFAAAAARLRQAIDLIAETGAAQEFAPEMMASLADCLARAGDLDEAASVARETAAMARLRGTRVAECRACIAGAEALMQTGTLAATAEAA
jgi:tetratricopeptide (TPR) repeat protein